MTGYRCPRVLRLFALGCVFAACGCQGGPGNPPPAWSWAPGSGARISPPSTGRGAYGSPDPYYQSSRSDNAKIVQDRDEYYARGESSDTEFAVSQASFSRDEERGRSDDDPLEFRGMPKSGERPKRNLVEMTDLPESQFGSRAPRRTATIMTPSSRTKRTPYRDGGFGYDDRGYDEDYRAASRDDSRWRRRE